jgi:hypothetical protein
MRKQQKPAADVYLAMWCNEGLEYLANVTEYEAKRLLAVLSDTKKPTAPPLEMMKMRARLNSQRSYEIYMFPVSKDISEETLRTAFEENPQPLVEMIRQQGEKMYSDYNPTKTRQMIV